MIIVQYSVLPWIQRVGPTDNIMIINQDIFQHNDQDENLSANRKTFLNLQTGLRIYTSELAI